MVATRALIGCPSTSAGAGLRLPGSTPGHSSRPFLARDVPDPQTRTSATWPGEQVLPSFRPAALLGLHPSQVCSRARVDTRGLNPAAKRMMHRSGRNSFSEAFLPVRTHLPVDRSHVPAPIDFRRGERPPGKDDCGGGRSRHFEIGPASGLRSRVRSVSSAIVRCRRSFLPWALPLAGLSATPAFPTEPTARVRARLRARPRIASPASGRRLSRRPIRSWALQRPSRLKNHFERLPPK